VAVESVRDAGEVCTVYNIRVADCHTYFVGCDEWGFSVWAHNAQCAEVVFENGKYYVKNPKGFIERKGTYDKLTFDTKEAAEAYITQKYPPGPQLYELGAPRYPEVLKGQKLGQAHSSTILGENLEAAGAKRLPNSDAHHIVGNDDRAKEALAILNRDKIDINEAANGVFLADSSEAARPPSIPHSRVHTNAYYEAMTQRLRDAGPGKGREVLQQIASELLKGTFPH
jgi:hypothetical protein